MYLQIFFRNKLSSDSNVNQWFYNIEAYGAVRVEVEEVRHFGVGVVPPALGRSYGLYLPSQDVKRDLNAIELRRSMR